jgi:hypothetical protein
MKFPKIAFEKSRVLKYVLFLGTTLAVIVALAQPSINVPNRIIVNGAVNPEKVPDWVAWDAFFKIALQLDERAPKHGKDVWEKKLNLPSNVVNEIVSHGHSQRDMQNSIANEAKNIPNSTDKKHPDKKQDVKSKLRKSQLNMEARTLELRDKLRKRIGEEQYSKIASFVRLQIAPKVKIGG